MQPGKKELTEEDKQLVVELYTTGLTISEVAKQLKFNHEVTRNIISWGGHARKNGFTTTWIDREHIKCSKCGLVKHISQIVYHTNNSHHKNGSYLSYCKDCRALQKAEARRGQVVPWSTRLARIAAKCRREGLENNLTLEYLTKLNDLQDGRCVYTTEVMLNTQGYGQNPMSISLDRIHPNRGYIIGNVIFCTIRANSIKLNQTLDELQEWMPLWYDRLMVAKPIWNGEWYAGVE